MLVLPTWVGLLLAMSSPVLAASDSSRIPMVRGKSLPLFLVQGTLNEKDSALFLVDTTATEHAVTRQFADQKKLKLVRRKGVPHRFARVGGLTFGNEASAAIDFRIVPTPSELKRARIAGVFSPQAHFDGRPFTLDFPAREIRSHAGTNAVQFGTEVEIKTVSPCPGHPKRMLATVYVNDLEGQFQLDTSVARTTLTRDFARRMTEWTSSASPSPTPSRKSSASRKIRSLKAIPIRFGPMNEKFTVQITDQSFGCTGADGKIGLDILERFRLSFSADLTSVQVSK